MKKIALLFVVCFVGFYGYAEGQIINEEVIECDGQECARRPRSSEIAGGCDKLNVGDKCEHSSGRAKTAKCVEITKESGGDKVKSCAAKECNDDYWLWVSGGHSMGVCHSIDETIRFCKKNGQCGEGCDCVPNEIPNPNRGYGGKAYDECHCVPKQSPVPPDNSCKTRFALEEVLHPGRIKCCQWAEEDNPKKAVHWDEKTHSCKCDNESLN